MRLRPDKTIYYQSASGEITANEDAQNLPLVMPSGRIMQTTFQNTAVTKPLLSVKRMCEEGKAVLFLPHGYGPSVVINMVSGEFEIEELREEEGNYILDAWIPPADPQPDPDDSANNTSGFVRQL